MIEFAAKADTEGVYKCNSIYRNPYCRQGVESESEGFNLTVVGATPTTQPSDGTVIVGRDHAITCEFKNFFYGKHAQIQWYFNSQVKSILSVI